jgi:hypothetical protein
VNQSICILTAALLTGQAGVARPMPQPGQPMVVEAAPVYMDGQGQVTTYPPPRRGLLHRVGGWLFGRNRNNNNMMIDGNGQMINGPMIQQGPMNTNEPPMAVPGKISLMPPGPQTEVVAAGSSPVTAAAHTPTAAATLDLPISDKFKTRIGHEADYSWLSGQLYRLQAGSGVLWVVRYANADEQDKHGGSVLLAPAINMRNFRDGDLVSVKGEVVNGGRKSEQLAVPVYRASDVSLVERAD